MRNLLDVATVQYGDGSWTAGYEVDGLSCGRSIETVDVCAGAATWDPSGDPAGTGFGIFPFAILGHQKFGERCAPAEAEAAFRKAMDDASEHTVAHNFWYGDTPDWDTPPGGQMNDMFLMDDDIDTVVEGASTADTIAAVLSQAFTNHPELDPIIHLGIKAAMDMTSSLFTDNFDAEFVVSTGYPIDGVAVTGPILVHLGSIEILTSHDTSVNRRYLDGTRLAAVEFDPCLAVRATSA